MRRYRYGMYDCMLVHIVLNGMLIMCNAKREVEKNDKMYCDGKLSHESFYSRLTEMSVPIWACWLGRTMKIVDCLSRLSSPCSQRWENLISKEVIACNEKVLELAFWRVMKERKSKKLFWMKAVRKVLEEFIVFVELAQKV